MNKIALIPCLLAVALAGCATKPYAPRLATPTIDPSTITGFALETPNRLEVTDGVQAWRVHLVGNCPELAKAGKVVFTGNQAIGKWPNQPWRAGYEFSSGWHEEGDYPNRSSSHMRVSSNRLAWVHAYSNQGKPLSLHASNGCQVEEVEPLWR